MARSSALGFDDAAVEDGAEAREGRDEGEAVVLLYVHAVLVLRGGKVGGKTDELGIGEAGREVDEGRGEVDDRCRRGGLRKGLARPEGGEEETNVSKIGDRKSVV